MVIRARPRVLVLGGGFAGLETAYYVRRKLADRAQVTLVSDHARFLFKPDTVYVPFGADPARLLRPLAPPLARRGIRFVHARAEGVDPDARVVETTHGKLGYDFLVVAAGAAMHPEDVPGLAEHGHTMWTPRGMLALRDAFLRIVADVQLGAERHVVFLIPPGNRCSGPVYELALMLDTWLVRRHARARVHLSCVTHEPRFLQAFGPRLQDVVIGEFARRGISGREGRTVERVTPGEIRFADDGSLPFDLLVSLPAYRGALALPGLPQDAAGFLLTDGTTGRVRGRGDVFAAGDAADFPVKQAVLALMQGDVVAERIAAAVLGRPSAATIEPETLCVMDQLDRATFAQVPLLVTGRPEEPVMVRPGAGRAYRVGTSAAWRFGKKAIGAYLPWCFASGRPTHAGLPWRGMKLGLKVLAAALAS